MSEQEEADLIASTARCSIRWDGALAELVWPEDQEVLRVVRKGAVWHALLRMAKTKSWRNN